MNIKLVNFKNVFFIIIFLLLFIFSSQASENLEKRFKGKDKLVYDVAFNALKVGTFEWEYLGRKKIRGKEVYVLSADSKTNIIGIFDLINKEIIFLERGSYLPIKVERELAYFGNKEIIKEFYDQDKGAIKIIKNNGNKLEQVIKQDKPIHNILALLYFFPKNIKLEPGNLLYFNLPTQKLTITVMPNQTINTATGKKEVYFLVGKGARSFRVWLDKKDRVPLRLDSTSLLGKVVITKK